MSDLSVRTGVIVAELTTPNVSYADDKGANIDVTAVKDKAVQLQADVDVQGRAAADRDVKLADVVIKAKEAEDKARLDAEAKQANGPKNTR